MKSNNKENKDKKLSLKKIKEEATNELNIAIKSAKKATSHAIRSSKALDLTIKSIENGNLIESRPNGNFIILKKIVPIKPKTEGLKKGISLCLKSND